MLQLEDSLYEAKQRQRALVDAHQKDSMRRASAWRGTSLGAPLGAIRGSMNRLGVLLEDLGCWLQSHGAARLLVVGVEYGGHMVVQQGYWLLYDPLEQGIVSGFGDGGVKSDILLGGELVANAGGKDRQLVEVFERSPAGGESGSLDLHRTTYLHEFDDAFCPLAEKRG